MKTIEEFLSHLCSLDIKIWVEGENLRCNAPKGKLTADLQAKIVEQKAAIIDFIGQKKGLMSTGIDLIPSLNRDRDLPLSFAQSRLWFLDQLEGQNTTYNLPAVLHLIGSLHVAALEQTIAEIVSRHEVLRTTFKMIGGVPTQVIHDSVKVNLPVIDLQNLPFEEKLSQVKKLATKDAQLPFDLSNDSLLRVSLVRFSEEEHVLLLTMHHIVADGWSVGVLIRELSGLYEAFCSEKPSPLPDLPIQYADFAAWQKQYLSGEVLQTLLNYWKQQLADAPPLLELPSDRPRPSVQSNRGSIHSLEISSHLTQEIKSLTHKSGTTLFVTLLATFVTLLARYSNQSDIAIGSPIANRNRAEIEPLIGFFVNTLVLRLDISENPTVSQLLQKVLRVALDAYTHQDLPLEKLVEELQPARSLSYTPLFQVMFVLQNAPIGKLELPGLTITHWEMENVTAKYDLTLSILETESGLRTSWEYNSDLFDLATINRMANHFQDLLEGMVSNPQQRVFELPILTDSEQNQLIRVWNNTQSNYPHDRCIHQLFEAQVERTPNALAVVFENQQLTYQELNDRANQLAHYLQKLGVEPEVLVGICLERSLNMLVGLLGILKAGGAYVPLDPTYPEERRAFMLQDSKISLLLTTSKIAHDYLHSSIIISTDKVETKQDPKQLTVICLDKTWEIIHREKLDNLKTKINLTSLAYILYTSGSTGQPKGVAIEHCSTVNFIHWAQTVFNPEQLSGVLASTSICFDLSIFELFVPLTCGGRVILAENALHLSNLKASNDVTLINTVPSAITELLRIKAIPPSVRTVNLAGERLSYEVVNQLYQCPNIERVFNLYGPSEATTYSTFSLCTLTENESEKAKQSPSIGRPIANTQIYILDPYLQPVPIGVSGELYIGGLGLARGYFNRPELTQNKFVCNPFDRSKLYRTGDLACYLPDGNIEFLGRIDSQVKIRGFRIELGEIEALLASHPDVREVVAIAQDDKLGNQRLVAYVVLNREPLNLHELRHFLKEKLPDYMIPSAFIPLEALPLTPNGKIDRATLSTNSFSHKKIDSEFVAPQTAIENILANIWSDILDIKSIGVHGNFFEVGGHSLLAVQVISRIKETFGVDLSLRSIFEFPTIAELSHEIQTISSIGDRQWQSSKIEKVDRDRDLPLSLVQETRFCLYRSEIDVSFGTQRQWFYQNSPYAKYASLGSAYSRLGSLIALQLEGELNFAALEKSFDAIVSRHEALRTKFRWVRNRPIQRVELAQKISLAMVDLKNVPEVIRKAEAIKLVQEEDKSPFDLLEDSVIRVKLLLLSEQQQILLLNIHHIVVDNRSFEILIQELALFYQAFSEAKPLPPLPELPIQPADFAYWQQQHIQGEVLEELLDYWKGHLSDISNPLEFPTDLLRKSTFSFQSGQQAIALSETFMNELIAFSSQQRVTLFMTLLTAFQVSLYSYSKQSDLIVVTSVSGRNRIEVENLISLFSNGLALRTKISGNPTFKELLMQVRELVLNAHKYQDLPFMRQLEILLGEDKLDYMPLLPVSFNLDRSLTKVPNFPGLSKIELLNWDKNTRSGNDLSLRLLETSTTVEGALTYNRNLFQDSTITDILTCFQTVLQSAVINPEQKISQLIVETKRSLL